MKTLTITLIAVCIFCVQTAFAFTAINLPTVKGTPISTIKAISYDITGETMKIVVPDKTNVLNKSMKDTILIDLTNENTISAFPGGSKDCIMRQVPYPEFAREKELEGGVAVRFNFDDTGRINITDICSNSPELEQYVVDKMTNLQLKNCVVDMHKDYYIRFMFRLF